MVNTATIHVNSGVIIFFFNNNSMILVLPSPHKAAARGYLGQNQGLLIAAAADTNRVGQVGFLGQSGARFHQSLYRYIYIYCQRDLDKSMR